MESVTIKDIARMCKVGVSTVSRAINNHPDINPETKEMIMQTIAAYDYVPNNSARNLKRSDARTIAVLVKGISNPLFNRMIRVIEERIKKENYSMELRHVDDAQDEVQEAMHLEKEKRLRGIIFLGGQFSHSDAKLKKLQVPFVLSTIGLIEDDNKKKYASVSVDDVKESKKIVNYLISRGHRKIAILGAREDDKSIGELRLMGYREALAENGILAEAALEKHMKEDLGNYSFENGYAMARELLEENADFTALYAISDQMAIGACKAIFESGKRIPEDYSVVGFDGLELARFYQPSITTLRQPMEEMAQATIDNLFDMIRKKSSNKHLVFEGKLIEADSVRDCVC